MIGSAIWPVPFMLTRNDNGQFTNVAATAGLINTGTMQQDAANHVHPASSLSQIFRSARRQQHGGTPPLSLGDYLHMGFGSVK